MLKTKYSYVIMLLTSLDKVHSVDVKMLNCGRLCSVQTRSSATIVQYKTEKAPIRLVKAAPSKTLLTKCNP